MRISKKNAWSILMSVKEVSVTAAIDRIELWLNLMSSFRTAAFQVRGTGMRHFRTCMQAFPNKWQAALSGFKMASERGAFAQVFQPRSLLPPQKWNSLRTTVHFCMAYMLSIWGVSTLFLGTLTSPGIASHLHKFEFGLVPLKPCSNHGETTVGSQTIQCFVDMEPQTPADNHTQIL